MSDSRANADPVKRNVEIPRHRKADISPIVPADFPRPIPDTAILATQVIDGESVGRIGEIAHRLCIHPVIANEPGCRDQSYKAYHHVIDAVPGSAMLLTR